ncbi:MAG TPA: histidine phosphatase family protein [Terriglobales bacterium]|nr:histidine phosphatase family protein [Terriglobales bacterium]
MIVYFMRHARAVQHKSNSGRDEKRPLDDEGIERSTQVGRALAGMDVNVDAVISSPLKRATQTACLVANEIGFEGRLQRSPALLPGAEMKAFRDLLNRNANLEALLVVGHNPNLSKFLSLLISEGASESSVDLKKCAVARADIFDGVGVLKWVLTPTMVDTLFAAKTKDSPQSKQLE